MKFNHESKALFESFGLKEEQMKRLRDKIIFATYSNHLKVVNEYKNEDDAPFDIRTLTGDLQTALNLINESDDETTTKEYLFLCFIFDNIHDLTLKMISLDNLMKKKEESKEFLNSIQTAIEVSTLVISNHSHSSVTPKEMLDKFKLIEKSNYSYDKFCLLAYNESKYVDGLLNTIL